MHGDRTAQLARPAGELFAHLPVEVHPEGARGSALFGQRDGGSGLGERHLGEPDRRRGGRRGRRGRRRGDRGCRGGRRSRRRGGGSGVLRLVHGDAVVGGQSLESAAVALADGAELPGTLAAVELAEHEGALAGRARAVEAGRDGALRGVLDLDVQARDPAEGAAVGGGREEHRLDAGLHAREVDEDGVGDLPAGVPLALVPDGSGGVGGLVVEDEVAVGADLAAGQQERGGVRVGDPGAGAPPQFHPECRGRHRRVRSLRHGHVRPHHVSPRQAMPGMRRAPSAQPSTRTRELPWGHARRGRSPPGNPAGTRLLPDGHQDVQPFHPTSPELAIPGHVGHGKQPSYRSPQPAHRGLNLWP